MVQVNLAKHNCRRIHEPSREVRAWFDAVEPNLLVYELNLRVRLRKNGVPVVPRSFVAYDDDYRVGVVSSVFVGCRVTAPYVAGCAVCSVRTLHRSRLELVDSQLGGNCNMILVDNTGEHHTPELVCCTKLRHRYVKVLWDPDHESKFALVRYEEY